MTSTALVPFFPQGSEMRPLVHPYPEVMHELCSKGKSCSLILPDRVSSNTRTDFFLSGEDASFYQRRLKRSYVPPPVGRNWRGYKQGSSSIRSNLRFSGTYAMEGRVLPNLAEKGRYIDFYS